MPSLCFTFATCQSYNFDSSNHSKRDETGKVRRKQQGGQTNFIPLVTSLPNVY